MRNPQRSPELQTLVTEKGLPVTILTLDVTNDESVEKTFKFVFEQEGYIDVLVNNAGIGGHGAVEETPMEMFRANMETNYFGALRCIKQVLPSMRKRRSGYIINVTSLAGTIASNFHSAYSASKFALESLSECLAQEVFEFNIKVAIVQPGVIDTPIFKQNAATVIPQTNYPRILRFFLEFQNSLKKGIPPGVVAKKIKRIIETENPDLRNPASIDAAPTLNWRKSMSDEEWIKYGIISDEDWCKRVDKDIADLYMQIIKSIELSNASTTK
jgi:NAD(P)-dependent dehydrogenase (short-subunit alcohol dehydrogenase family)